MVFDGDFYHPWSLIMFRDNLGQVPTHSKVVGMGAFKSVRTTTKKLLITPTHHRERDGVLNVGIRLSKD